MALKIWSVELDPTGELDDREDSDVRGWLESSIVVVAAGDAPPRRTRTLPTFRRGRCGVRLRVKSRA
jgi:hypothetical protein